MICPQCKNEIPEQGNFCPVCGAKKTEINPEATSIPVAETAKIPAKGRKKKTNPSWIPLWICSPDVFKSVKT